MIKSTSLQSKSGFSAWLFCGDCKEMRPFTPKALISDPPYGMDAKTDYKTRKRGSLAECNDFEPIVGDNEPFDPTVWLNYDIVALFGANWFADKLPISGAWIVWDKLDGLSSSREIGFNDNSDCELIWTNKGKAARIIRHRWMGCMKGSEHGEKRLHPTQKPVALMEDLIKYLTQPGDTVYDPYMGVGTTGVACMNTGRNFIGCEIVEGYFNIAVARIAAAIEKTRYKQATFLEE